MREILLSSLGSKITTLCTIDDTGGILVLKGKPIGKINEIDGIMELNLDAVISALPDPEESLPYQIDKQIDKNIKMYEPISQFPYILRDIAVFVPGSYLEENEKKIVYIIRENGEPFLKRCDIFDVFTKTKEGEETKTSYAFKLVFQSNDKTLTDEEINKLMSKISSVIATNGWQVR